MKNIRTQHNKKELFDFFNKSIGTYLYHIGDLDDKFWDKTKWFSLCDNDKLLSVALLYFGTDTPTFIALQDGNFYETVELVKKIKDNLPKKMYAHLAMNVTKQIGKFKIIEHHGKHYKMIFRKLNTNYQDNNIRQLTIDNLPIIKELYSLAYPNNWFDVSMLTNGLYLGYFDNDKLVGIAGTHILSEEYQVSALGNIATHPEYRGQKISTKLTSTLCYKIQSRIKTIGLNVYADNIAAITAYKNIGFEIVNDYEECLIDNISG